MKKYPEYKSSEVKWLNEIPSGWDSNRLASFGRFTKGSSISKSNLVNQGLPVILYGDIYTKYNLRVNNVINFIPKELADVSKLIRRGDILFTGSGETREDIGKCIVYISNKEAYAGGDTIIFTPKNHDCLFLAYSLNSNIVVSKKAMDSKGDIIVHIYASSLRNISIPIPPLSEQQTIVRFLDYKTGQIDRFIANRQKQIELLKAQRAALINKAVTKGINPHDKMKDSGVGWIGEVPEHWKVWKLKFLTKKIGSGVTPLGGSEVYKTEGVAFFRSQNIYDDRFELSNISFIDVETHKGMKNSKVLVGDVLLNITGASIGRCYYFSSEYPEANVNQHVCIIRANKNIQFQFLHSVMISEIGQNQIFSKQSGTNREGLNFEQLKQFDIPLPPIDEQKAILDFIKTETSTIDTLISKYQKQIELMQEYRTSLISQAVTGKIDVRDWEPAHELKVQL